ncbi:PLDc N-terminal domain-containing protein [Methanococcoides seepicolus]|uniref:PLDc N-terminal domain-containing protein n=2 Tax=Methanococcoides seepicolus TaxID=2828780 RepID=A0A9E4ZE24_9EURY|nr:PLDc N-terminal domain-containing protein [Methanococcoides seepicolus]
MNKIRSEWTFTGLMIFFTTLVFTFYVGQLLWGIIAIAILFWIFMLCDCLQRNTEDFPRTGEHEKLIWSVVLIVLNFIGAIMYYFLVRMQDNRMKIL